MTDRILQEGLTFDDVLLEFTCYVTLNKSFCLPECLLCHHQKGAKDSSPIWLEGRIKGYNGWIIPYLARCLAYSGNSVNMRNSSRLPVLVKPILLTYSIPPTPLGKGSRVNPFWG